MRERSIQLATGETTRVREDGPDGAPAVVLVHALANSVEIWERVFPRLSHNFRVIAFDLPGFGQASRPLAKYDGAFFAEQLKALLDALDLERPILIGNSLGASVVVRFAATAPDRIARAVLAAPGGFGRKTNLLMRLPALALHL
ncbi:MAG: alpha/beta fold hydrolase [Variibacter sp.]